MIKVLHITSHLGGGVGKVLSNLISQSIVENKNVKSLVIEHSVVCLEETIDKQFYNKIKNNKIKIITSPSYKDLEFLMKDYDIVQLEFWNHPIMLKYLCNMNIPPIRLIIWYHNSGLHTPIVDKELILKCHKFIFTSKCSFENKKYLKIYKQHKNIIDIVSSSCGFSNIKRTNNRILYKNNISVGYLGNINFSKMHPHYVDYMSNVNIKNFKVKIIGKQIFNVYDLNKQCDSIGKHGMLKFTGFVSNLERELNSINVIAYLLNPYHYGSGENALVEAMSIQIVPIVLCNPAEECIVINQKTGLIVNSKKEFGKAVEWLNENPSIRIEMGYLASKYVKDEFSIEKIEYKLRNNYNEVIKTEKNSVNFKDIFGNKPSDWFLYFQKHKDSFKKNGTVLLSNNKAENYIQFEESKGSTIHFNEYFPEDLLLEKWSSNVRKLYVQSNR